MSSRKVEGVMKKNYNGVGPSHATIHHYVVTKGEIGTSPQKRGPIGHIPVVAYKSFCRICNVPADQSVELHGWS